MTEMYRDTVKRKGCLLMKSLDQCHDVLVKSIDLMMPRLGSMFHSGCPAFVASTSELSFVDMPDT